MLPVRSTIILRNTERGERKKSGSIERESEQVRVTEEVTEAIGGAGVKSGGEEIAALRGRGFRLVVRWIGCVREAGRECDDFVGACFFRWRRCTVCEHENRGQDEECYCCRKVVDRIVDRHD